MTDDEWPYCLKAAHLSRTDYKSKSIWQIRTTEHNNGSFISALLTPGNYLRPRCVTWAPDRQFCHRWLEARLLEGSVSIWFKYWGMWPIQREKSEAKWGKLNLLYFARRIIRINGRMDKPFLIHACGWIGQVLFWLETMRFVGFAEFFRSDRWLGWWLHICAMCSWLGFIKFVSYCRALVVKCQFHRCVVCIGWNSSPCLQSVHVGIMPELEQQESG